MFDAAGDRQFHWRGMTPFSGLLALTLTAGCVAVGPGGGWLAVPTSLFRGQSPEPLPPLAATGPSSEPGPSLPEELEPAAAQGPTEPRGPVLSVSIVGNQRVKESDIRRHIKSRPDRAYDPHLIQEDLRRLFATRKFHNVRVQKQVEPRGVHVTFEVVERPLVDEVLFIGNRYYSDKKLLKESGLERDEPLNIYTVQEARRRLEEFYHSKGYATTQVSILEGDEPSDRRVVLQVDEGRIERIWDVKFVGNDPHLATGAGLKTLIKSKPGFLKYLFRGKVDHALIEQRPPAPSGYYRGLGYFQRPGVAGKAPVRRISGSPSPS